MLLQSVKPGIHEFYILYTYQTYLLHYSYVVYVVRPQIKSAILCRRGTWSTADLGWTLQHGLLEEVKLRGHSRLVYMKNIVNIETY